VAKGTSIDHLPIGREPTWNCCHKSARSEGCTDLFEKQ